MKDHSLSYGRHQRGVAAIEFALILPVLALLLAVTLFFGRFFWHYTVLQKAAHDAAIVLASATKIEIGTNKADYTSVEVASLAKAIAEEETAELPGEFLPHIEVSCDNADCIGDQVPSQVTVLIRMKLYDDVLGGYTGDLFGGGIWVRADVRMPYVGD